MDRLKYLAEHGKLKSLKQLEFPSDFGKPCAAKYMQDDVWYRGEVLGMENERYVVSFVDFGDTEVLPPVRVKEIPDELLVVPRASVTCYLKGLDHDQIGEDQWNEARAWITDRIFEKLITLQVDHFSEDLLACEGRIYQEKKVTKMPPRRADVALRLMKEMKKKKKVGK